jgi:hypothetical protein
MKDPADFGRFTRSGAIAGAVSAFVFTIIHDLFISDIWPMLLPLLIAGMVCGLCIGWSYGLLFQVTSVGSWLGYNLLYVVMFGLLGLSSVVVYEPVTTLAAVVAAQQILDGPQFWLAADKRSRRHRQDRPPGIGGFQSGLHNWPLRG